MKSARKSGIVLITTLLMMVLVVMIVTVVVFTGAGGLALTGNFYEREAALLAADSGIQYAMARLQANPNWRGDEPGTAPAPRATFSVVEKDGNVFGFVSTVSGHRSQFRIKFNYEDGAGGLDGLDNTVDAAYVLPTNLVSINNLMGTASTPAKRANLNGYGVASAAATYDVPRATACIFAEGMAGWGLREADRDHPDNFLAGRAVTHRVVEAYLTIDNSNVADSAAYAAGSIDASLVDGGVFSVSSKDDDVSPRVRSLQDVAVAADPALGPVARGVTWDDGSDGEVVVGTGKAFTVGGATPADAKVTQANSSALFKRITWNSISKASATSATDSKVKGGTYVWRLDSQDTPYLEYFDREYAEGQALPAAGTGTRIDSSNITTSGTGVSVDNTNLCVEVSNNVYVNPTSHAGGVAILTDPALTNAGMRPAVGFVPPSGSQRAPILTASGSVRFEGAVLGTGSVTSEGSITFQGPSILESDPETGVSLYAKGDINVEAIPAAVATARADVATAVVTDVKGGVALDPDVFVVGGVVGAPTAPPPRIGSGPRVLPSATPIARPLVPPGLIANPAAFTIKKQDQLTRFVDTFGDVDYADQNLTGVIYTWRNFNANLEGRGVLSVTGTLIAYGGDPSSVTNSAPGSFGADSGKININARGVDLQYDSSYLKDLLSQAGPVQVKRILWATFQ